MKKVVKVIEVFEKYVIVNVDENTDAIDKCWETREMDIENNPVVFYYPSDANSVLNYELADADTERKVLMHSELFYEI